MLSRLLGPQSSVTDLKAGLNRSTEAVRQIAHRVANASTKVDGGFSSALDSASGPAHADEVDLEQEMVALADEQLRYEATSRLLEKMYQQIRFSVRDG